MSPEGSTAMSNVASMPIPVRGIRRLLYIAAGLGFVGLGLLGALLPGLPATPFLLLASWAFVRSEPRLHRWVTSLPGCGPVIRHWEEHRTVSERTKWTAVALIVTAITATFVLGPLSRPLGLLVLGLGAIGLTVVCRLPAAGQQVRDKRLLRLRAGGSHRNTEVRKPGRQELSAGERPVSE